MARSPGPTAGVIDSQTIKPTESGGISGYDAGKKTKGRKRHIVTDTLGFMVGLVVHSAGIQDRDGAPEVLKSIRYSHPNLRHIFADGGYVRIPEHSATCSSDIRPPIPGDPATFDTLL